MRSRAYEAADRESCVRAFMSNVPTYFLPHELNDFEEFLARLPGPYFVIVHANDIVACGGYAEGRVSGQADICWTIVHREHHGRGIGDYLMRTCLDGITMNRKCHTVRLETSQHTRAFFERFGFEAVEITRDGFGVGLDRVEMLLQKDTGEREKDARDSRGPAFGRP